MKNLGKILLSKEPISEIVMGNTAIVRAMIETGTRVVTSYPGSPTPEIASAISSISVDERPFYFEFSTNEKVATEVAYGASVNGHLSCVFFKSVGLNVASDTFVQLGYMELIGGMVVVLGDDPGLNSSQNEQDNRHYAHISYIPMLEPSNPQEIYLMYKEAAKMSVKLKMPIILRLTTHTCHFKSKVSFGEWKPAKIDNTPRFDANNGPYIPITNLVVPMKKKLFQKLETIKEYSEKSIFNKIIDNNNKNKGIITAGLPFMSTMDCIENTNDKPDILRIAFPYPIPKKLIIEFLKNHKEVKVLEELDDVLEKEIKTLAYENRLETKIIGKIDTDDWMGEYTPEKVYSVLNKTWSGLLPEIPKTSGSLPTLPSRPAQMCPGCGHRSAFFAIKKALANTDITVADIGCHTLGFLPPYNMGQLLMCMGASTGIASGLSLFNNERKVVAFMGDSTFFHAGGAGIMNALFNKHNLTLILMENGTTAMTGHQDHPAAGKNFNGETNKIPVKQVLEGYGAEVFEVDTYQQAKLTQLVKEAIAKEGLKVIIAKHPCMLKLMKANLKRENYVLKQVSISEKCNKQHICVSEFGCPSFFIDDDGRITVNTDLCIGDGSCIQTCPTKAINQPKEKGTN